MLSQVVMDIHLDTRNLQPAPGKTYIVLPPEPDPEPEPFFSVRFILFCAVVFNLAVLGGSIQSGRIRVDRYLHLKEPPTSTTVSFAPSVAAASPVAPVAHASPSASGAPGSLAKPVNAALALIAPTFPPDTFVVSSISIGNPSFAIINGVSRFKDSLVETDTVKGWTVRTITENSVVLQNGRTLKTIPLSAPKLKPLDDTLQPLN
jgi:hypothetical protein